MLDELLDLVFPLAFIWQLILGFLWWIVLLPFLWALASPVILTLAIFDTTPCWSSVSRCLRVLTAKWSNWGLRYLP
jgi:hypothetical protein